MATKKLRAVTADDVPAGPQGLMDAVESGDVLLIAMAQRRIIAEALLTAGDNTRPQYSNELNKLNKLIAEEQARRAVADSESSVVAELESESWNASGY